MKKVFSAVFMSALIAVCTMGCFSMGLKDQKDPSKSLLVVKFSIPSDFDYIDSDINSENNKSYNTTYISRVRTFDKKELNAFINIPEGKYRLKRIYATTPTVGRMYRQLSLKFENIPGKAASADNWIEIKAGSVKYAGLLDFIAVDKKDEIFASLAKAFHKSPQEIEKAIIYECKMTTTKGDTVNCIVVRLDHPAIVGDNTSLLMEREVWQVLVNYNYNVNNAKSKWTQMMKERIDQLTKDIAALSNKK